MPIGLLAESELGCDGVRFFFFFLPGRSGGAGVGIVVYKPKSFPSAYRRTNTSSARLGNDFAFAVASPLDTGK